MNNTHGPTGDARAVLGGGELSINALKVHHICSALDFTASYDLSTVSPQTTREYMMSTLASPPPASPRRTMHRSSSSTSHPTTTSLRADSATAVAGPSSPRSTGVPLLSPRLPPSPILVQTLPSTFALEQEGIAHSELELDRQIKQAAREKALAEALQEQQWGIERAQAKEDSGGGGLAVLRNLTSRSKAKANAGAGGAGGPTAAFERPPQAYELYQAIDRKDVDFLMRVRDHAFGLLLQKNAGEFPILYAARIGQSHRDVVILLVGALSRYVNHLEEGDFEKKETKGTLKALRANVRSSRLALDGLPIVPSSKPSLPTMLTTPFLPLGPSAPPQALGPTSNKQRRYGKRC